MSARGPVDDLRDRFGRGRLHAAAATQIPNAATSPEHRNGHARPVAQEPETGQSQTGGSAADSEEDAQKKKGALALVELAADCSLFVDDREDAYAAIPLPTGGREIRRLKSRYFKSWLLNRHFTESGQAAGRDAQDSAIRLLEAMAMQSGERCSLTERFSCEAHDSEVRVVWIDLGDAAWRAIKVTAAGYEIVERPPILFRRHENTEALPEPMPGGKIDELFAYLTMREESDRIGILAWLIAAMFSDVSRPMLVLQGVQGAAKTTSARVLRGLLDPSRTEVLAPPRSDEQLLHQLGKHAIPTYDNLSLIPDWMADAFCRAVTGGASEKRSLYSDGDSVLVSFRRAIILTGINTPSDAPDLLSRALRVELEAVSPEERREEGEFWASFREARPRLFGALLDAVAATLRQLPKTRPAQLQRMADFTRIGAAAAEALGFGQAMFLDAYAQAADKQTAEQLDTDPVAIALREFLAQRNGIAWEGKTGDLFDELRPPDRNIGFPKTAAWLGRRLNILRPSLAQAGVGVEPADLADHGRGWRIRSRP